MAGIEVPQERLSSSGIHFLNPRGRPMAQRRITSFRPRLEALEDRMTMSGPGANNPGVLPPQSNPYGASYGEWSAKWWQWAFSMPHTDHPLFDTAPVSEGQS